MPKKDQKPSTSLRLQSRQNNLIPRDISESLGKLPPQAIELEIEILGAILLEKKAFESVIPFLKPEHFYSEAHSEIYQAALDQKAAGNPVDMKTVVQRLRETAKIDLVGGSYYVADLTSKVSSSANVEYSARVIIEMAVKRFAIQVASQIHHDAYEDTTDVFELLDKSLFTLKEIKEHQLESGHSRIEALWQDTLVISKPKDDRVLIQINGVDVCSENNHSLLVGKKKTRKTLFVTLLLSESLKAKILSPDEVAIFDTEQGRSHVWRLREKIKKMTGFEIPIFYLRGMAPADRREFISLTVKHWKTKLKFIVNDGIRDCMSNINDPDETTEVIVWLEKLTLEHSLHVMNILHLNKTDDNARGHIGTELLNKAQITFQMSKNPADGPTGPTIVECESSRDMPFDKFAFTHGPAPDHLPEIVGVPIQGNIIPEDDQRNRLRNAFDGQLLKYPELLKAIQTEFSDPTAKRQIGKNKAETMISKWVRDGWIIKTGKPRDPKSMYKLMITEEGQFVPLEEAKARQAELFKAGTMTIEPNLPQNGHHKEESERNSTKNVQKPQKPSEKEPDPVVIPPETTPVKDDGTDTEGNFVLF